MLELENYVDMLEQGSYVALLHSLYSLYFIVLFVLLLL